MYNQMAPIAALLAPSFLKLVLHAWSAYLYCYWWVKCLCHYWWHTNALLIEHCENVTVDGILCQSAKVQKTSVGLVKSALDFTGNMALLLCSGTYGEDWKDCWFYIRMLFFLKHVIVCCFMERDTCQLPPWVFVLSPWFVLIMLPTLTE